MSAPPELLLMKDNWQSYEEAIYEAFLESFVRPNVTFRGHNVSAPYRPESRGKHFSFWHVISEAPHPSNQNEDERIPDLRRCERIRWITWAIQAADAEQDGISWWENQRGRDTHVVIWAEEWDFAVILGKRRDYYVLKTAYSNLRSSRIRAFEKERAAFWRDQKD
jgi:hypothetical protein